MSVADTPALLEEARRGDNDACARLIEENAGLIWSIVRRYYGRGTDPEDLYQLGCQMCIRDRAVHRADGEHQTALPVPFDSTHQADIGHLHQKAEKTVDQKVPKPHHKTAPLRPFFIA